MENTFDNRPPGSLAQRLAGDAVPPPPPVWPGVQADIARKRRRGVLWFWLIPTLCGLGGLTYTLTNHLSEPLATEGQGMAVEQGPASLPLPAPKPQKVDQDAEITDHKSAALAKNEEKIDLDSRVNGTNAQPFGNALDKFTSGKSKSVGIVVATADKPTLKTSRRATEAERNVEAQAPISTPAEKAATALKPTHRDEPQNAQTPQATVVENQTALPINQSMEDAQPAFLPIKDGIISGVLAPTLPPLVTHTLPASVYRGIPLQPIRGHIYLIAQGWARNLQGSLGSAATTEGMRLGASPGLQPGMAVGAMYLYEAGHFLIGGQLPATLQHTAVPLGTVNITNTYTPNPDGSVTAAPMANTASTRTLRYYRLGLAPTFWLGVRLSGRVAVLAGPGVDAFATAGADAARVVPTGAAALHVDLTHRLALQAGYRMQLTNSYSAQGLHLRDVGATLGIGWRLR